MVDEKVKAKSIHKTPVSNDGSFILRYNVLSLILKECGDTTFGRMKHNKHNANFRITSPKIQQIQSNIRHLGGALQITQESFSREVSHMSLMVYQRYLAMFQANPNNADNFRSYLLSQRQTLCKKLYNERMSEIYARSQATDKKCIVGTSLGGSAKRLMSTGDHIGMPTALTSTNGDTLVTDPELVKSTTKDYWSTLYKQQDIPNVPKPWLSTPSVLEV
jgi:hypothetical protein